MLEPFLMSTLCDSFFVNLLIKLSISMYIMCVILCLFSALSRRVGTLHISIIIKPFSHCNKSLLHLLVKLVRNNYVVHFPARTTFSGLLTGRVGLASISHVHLRPFRTGPPNPGLPESSCGLGDVFFFFSLFVSPLSLFLPPPTPPPPPPPLCFSRHATPSPYASS